MNEWTNNIGGDIHTSEQTNEQTLKRECTYKWKKENGGKKEQMNKNATHIETDKIGQDIILYFMRNQLCLTVKFNFRNISFYENKSIQICTFVIYWRLFKTPLKNNVYCPLIL